MNDMTICSQSELAKADADMQKVYQLVLARVGADSQDEDFNRRYKQALEASQDAWLHFRDAECLVSNFDRDGGSSQSMNINGCKAGLARVRIDDLLGLINSLKHT